MGSNKTYDGNPLCMGVSGFVHYDTERADAPQYPPVTLGPSDLLNLIKDLQNLVADPKFSEAVKLLKEHINNKNNPHQVTMDQLLGKITQALYNEFIKRTGCTITLEEYEKALFELIHLANDQEINEGTCPTAVLSVYGARKYIDRHDRDPNAHSTILENILPGDPIIEDPSYAWYPQFGFSEYNMYPVDLGLTEEDNDTLEIKPYTYVGVDGYIHTAENNVLPVDYAWGTPMIPCFGTRRNSYTDSTSLSTFEQMNVNLLQEAEEAPDRTVTATAIYTNEDEAEMEHGLIYRNFILERNQPMTISFYVKPEKQTVLKISWVDVINSGIETYAVYDLQNNQAVIINHLDRYNCSIQKLSNGWYRCGFSMYNTEGRLTDLTITFADNQGLDNVENWKWTTASTGEICGFIWGIQVEDGFQMSPYIPTTGKIGIRAPIDLKITLDPKWFTPTVHTYHVDYWNCEKDPSIPSMSYRPVFLAVNETEKNTFKSLYVRHRNNAFVLTRYYTHSNNEISYDISTLQDEINLPDTDMIQFTTGIDKTNMITRVNSTLSVKSHTAPYNTATHIYLGTDGEGNYYNGYIADLTIYPIRVDEMEAQFLNGEDYE